MGLTFGIVCITWVFFRARTLPGALAYLACLCGIGPASAASDAIAAIIYTKYHMIVFIIAALLVWQSPSSVGLLEANYLGARWVHGFAVRALGVLHVDAERKPIHLFPVLTGWRTQAIVGLAHDKKSRIESSRKSTGDASSQATSGPSQFPY